jgi:ribosomal protein L23
MSMVARDIILAPVITEKTHDSIERGTYAFQGTP